VLVTNPDRPDLEHGEDQKVVDSAVEKAIAKSAKKKPKTDKTANEPAE
jgi:hypothetical protein